MSFVQFKLDKISNQTRGIFDTFIYKSDEDDMETVAGEGYFAASRFVDDEGWNGGKLECKCSDGYFEGFIDASTGTVTPAISSEPEEE